MKEKFVSEKVKIRIQRVFLEEVSRKGIDIYVNSANEILARFPNINLCENI